MQRERELRERIEEQKREKAEREAHRRQVLAQIEADRRERIATSTPKPKGPEGSSSDTKSAAFNPDEVCVHTPCVCIMCIMLISVNSSSYP